MSKIQMNNDARSDEELVALVQNGDQKIEELIFKRYRGLVRSLSRRFFLVGGDMEDLTQEGMMGLYQAMREYDTAKKSSFKTFAYLCVHRRIVDAVKAASGKKNEPLLGGISALAETLQAGDPSPEDLIILNEEQREFNQKISKILSDFEFKIVVMYIDGLTTLEIGEILGKSTKSIDNAIQRSKRKLQILKK